MSFGAYLFFMATGTILSWGAWYMVLNNVNPDESGWIGYAMFYLTLVVALIGTLSLLELLIRKTISREHMSLARDVRTSFRHGVMLAIIAAASLGLAAESLFTWWALLIMLVVAAVIEYLSLVVQQAHRG